MRFTSTETIGTTTRHTIDAEVPTLVTELGRDYRAAVVDVTEDGDVWVFFVRRTKLGQDFKRGTGVWVTLENLDHRPILAASIMGALEAMTETSDEDVIRELGHAELGVCTGTMSDDDYQRVTRSVIARFGEEGMDNLMGHWTALRADPVEIAEAETTYPRRYVRIARGRLAACDVCSSTQEGHEPWCSEGPGLEPDERVTLEDNTMTRSLELGTSGRVWGENPQGPKHHVDVIFDVPLVGPVLQCVRVADLARAAHLGQ